MTDTITDLHTLTTNPSLAQPPLYLVIIVTMDGLDGKDTRA